MTKRSSATLPIPDVVQAFLDELDAERKVQVREKMRKLREWDEEFFKSHRTTSALDFSLDKTGQPFIEIDHGLELSATPEGCPVLSGDIGTPTEKSVEPTEPAETKVTTSSPVEPAKAPASSESEVKHENVHNQNPLFLSQKTDYVQNNTGQLEVQSDNVQNHLDAEWFSAENLQAMAEALTQCPDRETLDDLRQCWPVEPMKAASRLLSPEDAQKIKGWVIESNELAQKRKLWESEAPITTDLGYGIALDSTQNHTLRETEPIPTDLGYTLPLDSASNHTLRKTEPLPIAASGSNGVVSPTYQLVTDAQSLAESLKPLAAASAIALDTETTGLDPHQHKIRLVQIAVQDRPVVIVDLGVIAPEALDPLRQLLTGPAIKVFHNGKFDWKFLVKAGLKPTGPYFDTMLSSQLLKAGLPGSHSLKAIASEYLGVELDKDQQSSDWSGEISPAQLEYAARDAAILLQLREVMKPKLVEAGLVEAAKLEFEVLPAVASMELHGMLLDLSKWEALGREMEQSKAKVKAELVQQLRSGNPQISLLSEVDAVNPDSPSQILAALKAMGIPVESTGKNALISLADEYPVINTMLEYRRYSKAVSSFTDKFPKHINPVTGRIHANYNQYGAASGRASASNPNLQQVPRGKEVRSCFIPTPGYKLCISDFSQVELRVAAEISGDRTMISAYQKGEDLHKLTAALVNKKSLDQVTKTERQAAKAINFGLIYGCGAKRLKQQAKSDYGVDLTLEQCETFRKKYFESYSGIARWHRQLINDKLVETRTLSGRRRQWKEELPWVTALAPSIVSGTAADIAKVALAKLPTVLEGTGARLIGFIHDEILLESPEATADEAARILQDCMIRAGETYLKLVPVEVEACVADSWADK